ncbi:SGNH/GDSL hydrolase family protein [Streptomyces sp. AJS327]|nr:SGNH/GDSL hydrolase family protein [Streptomyces sp. AJS327]
MLLTSGTASAAPAEPAEAQRYVALGDSYASLGSLTKVYVDPATGCMRSKDNYPARVAEGMKPGTFVDATCAGAVTDGVLSPQLDAVTPETDLVTLTVGGNDIGFADIALRCGLLSVTNPLGTPCQDHYTEGGTDRLAKAIEDTAPKVDRVLAAIADRAPEAKVVVTGYLRILPPDNGCWPLMPISRGDVTYVNSVQDKLNGMIADRARAAGASFVDPSTTGGHDVCQAPSKRWVDGLLPLSNGTPIHPTAAGQAHVAELVRGAAG